MSSEEKSGRSAISLPFIVIVGGIALVGILFGRTIMERVFLYQESQKVGPVVEMARDPDSLNMRPAISGSGNGGPATIFKRRDADENGLIEGDEIRGQLKASLADIDSNEDGAISLEELEKAMAEDDTDEGDGDSGAGEGADTNE